MAIEIPTQPRRTYLDINEVAEQLGVSAQTLYRWRSLGTDMPAGFRVGAQVRWRQETVDEWVRAQEAKASVA